MFLQDIRPPKGLALTCVHNGHLNRTESRLMMKTHKEKYYPIARSIVYVKRKPTACLFTYDMPEGEPKLMLKENLHNNVKVIKLLLCRSLRNNGPSVGRSMQAELRSGGALTMRS